MSANTRVGLTILAGSLLATAVHARDVTVHVDAQSGPWLVRSNPKLNYGLGNAKPPKMVWGSSLLVGSSVTFHAEGRTTTVEGGGDFGPNGQKEWTDDHGGAPFPSHFMETRRAPIHLNELVGAFVSADGVVVGKPFAIGEDAQIPVPAGAAAIALGINDDNYANNTGTLTVSIHIPEAQVIVSPTGSNP